MTFITNKITHTPILYFIFLANLITLSTCAVEHPGSQDPCNPKCLPGFELRQVQMPACEWTCKRQTEDNYLIPFLIRFGFFFATCFILYTWTAAIVKRAAAKEGGKVDEVEASIMLILIPVVMACVSMVL